MNELTKQERIFVNEVAITGNRTQSTVKAFKEKNEVYAGVKGHRLIRKDKIKKAIIEARRTIAEQIPDELLVKVHLEGLEAGKRTFKNNNETGEIEDMGIEPDYATRHKYLASGYDLKGVYAPEKSVNININATQFSNEEQQALLNLIGK